MNYIQNAKPLWAPLVIVIVASVAVFFAGYHNAAWVIGNLGTVLALVFIYVYTRRMRRS